MSWFFSSVPMAQQNFIVRTTLLSACFGVKGLKYSQNCDKIKPRKINAILHGGIIYDQI
jgi:hypothetical protein